MFNKISQQIHKNCVDKSEHEGMIKELQDKIKLAQTVTPEEENTNVVEFTGSMQDTTKSSSKEDASEQPPAGEELSPEVKRLLAEAVSCESIIDMFKHQDRSARSEKMYNEAVSMTAKITSCIVLTEMCGNEHAVKGLSSEHKEAIDKEIKDLNSEIFGEDGEVEVVKAKNGVISAGRLSHFV